MKRISFLLIGLLGAAPLVRGQDAASPAPSNDEMVENYKALKGHVQDLSDAQAQLDKRLQDLAKQVSDMRDQMAKPAGNFATPDDIKRLADAIQEIDRKREADKQLILDEIKKLGNIAAAPPAPAHHEAPKTTTASDTTTAAPASDDTGFNYVIKKGDTLSVIAQAYREQQGIKVTVDQILKANPGLNPSKLIVGKKIFIPAPKQQ